MKKTVILLLIGIVLTCAGCSSKENPVSDGPKLYYVNEEETKLVTQEYTPVADKKSSLVEEYIIALSTEPKDTANKLAKPKEITILGYNFSAQQTLQLSFDTNYYDLSGPREVLMRAAIVKTFTQIDGIDSVEFYINGLPLVLGQDTPIGRMEAADFIDNVGDMTSYKQTAMISIYFANESGKALLESQRQVEYDGSIMLEQVIVEQLIAGPVDGEEGMISTLPEGTQLNRITKKEGICTVDFNEEFLNGNPNVPDDVMIYSIVNTLVEQPSIDKVQFTINGETTASLKNINLSQPFERNLNIIESEQ